MVKVGDFGLVTGDLSSGSSGMFIAIVWDQEYNYILLMGYTVSFLDVTITYIMVIYLVWIQYISLQITQAGAKFHLGVCMDMNYT